MTHIGELVPDPANRRAHNPRNIGMVVDALHKVGAARSIVIDEDNVILAGNGVTEAAAEAGITKVRVVEADGHEIIAVRRTGLTAEQKRALAIFDNRTAELAEWNADQLRADVDAGLDLKPWFTEGELADLLSNAAVQPKDGQTDPDAAVEPPHATSVAAGDIYQLGPHRVACGSCTDESLVYRLFDGKSASITFTSPPYNAGKSEALSGNTHTTDNKYQVHDDDMDGGDWLSLMGGFTALALRISNVVIVNVQLLSGNKRPLVEYLAAFKDNLIDLAIWDKTHAAPAMAERVMNSQFEFLVFFTSLKTPASRSIPTAAFRGTVPNVYTAPPQRQNDLSHVHAATFPVHLPTWAISTFDATGGTVFDPFLGTGTTLIACERLGRTCYGTDIDPTYVHAAIERWEAFTDQKAVKVGEAVAA